MAKIRACNCCLEKCAQIHTARRQGSHMHGSFYSFSKEIQPGFSPQCLKISGGKRMQKCRSEGTMCLQGPTGHLWLVKLRCYGGSLVLHEGWKNFVEDHRIVAYDILIFSPIISGHFTVRIFRNGCEKPRSVFSHKKCSCCLASRVAFRAKPEEDEEVNVSCLHGDQNKPSTEIVPVTKTEIIERVVPCTMTSISDAIKTRKTRIPENKGDLHKFTVALPASAVGGVFFLTVPQYIWQKWFSANRTNCKILCNLACGKPAIFPVTLHSYVRYAGFTAGWRKVVRRLSLKKGDTCIFTLVDKLSFVFRLRVHQHCCEKPVANPSFITHGGAITNPLEIQKPESSNPCVLALPSLKFSEDLLTRRRHGMKFSDIFPKEEFAMKACLTDVEEENSRGFQGRFKITGSL